MTDNEIAKIRALAKKRMSECKSCELSKLEFCSICVFGAVKLAIDIVDRQRTEIEEMQAEIERLENAMPSNKYACCVAVKNGVIYTHTLGDYDWLIGDIGDEVIKAFVERLCEGRVSNDPVVIAAKCLEKEMTKGDE